MNKAEETVDMKRMSYADAPTTDYLKNVNDRVVIDFDAIADSLMPSMASLVAFGASPALAVLGLLALDRAVVKFGVTSQIDRARKWLRKYKWANFATTAFAAVARPLAALSFIDILVKWGDMVASCRTIRMDPKKCGYNVLDVWELSNSIVPYVDTKGAIEDVTIPPTETYRYYPGARPFEEPELRDDYTKVFISFDDLMLAVLATSPKYCDRPITGQGATALREAFMWSLCHFNNYAFVWVKVPAKEAVSRSLSDLRLTLTPHQSAPLVMAAYVISLCVPIPHVKLIMRAFLIKQGKDLAYDSEFKSRIVAYSNEGGQDAIA